MPNPRQGNNHTIANLGASSAMGLSSPNVIGVHYKVGKKIGEGSFGVIYDGQNMLTNKPIAIKFESKKSDAPQLKDEYRTYKILQGTVGIPGVYYYGSEGAHNVLCIDLLGKSLEDLFDMCHRKFSIKTVAMLAKNMIARVQSVHEKSLIYRDIKPDNFLIGHPATKEANQVYMVDFGMAKFYRDPKTKQHIPYRERKSLSGTARYMSINTHLGREQSRRDDLESLGHVFMYFLRGSLPWQGLKAATNKQKYEKIGEKKQTTRIDDLCGGFPEEFATYMTYVRKLGFEETPEYEQLKLLFDRVLKNMGTSDDGIYDWMILKEGKNLEPQLRTPRVHTDNHTKHATLGTSKAFGGHNESIGLGATSHASKQTEINTPRPSIQRGQSANNGSLSPRPVNLLPSLAIQNAKTLSSPRQEHHSGLPSRHNSGVSNPAPASPTYPATAMPSATATNAPLTKPAEPIDTNPPESEPGKPSCWDGFKRTFCCS